MPNFSLGKAAAFDFVVVSPLVQQNILVAGGIELVDTAAVTKHTNNDAKCDVLGWTCIPLAVDSYGRWGAEAHVSFGTIASHLSVHKNKPFGCFELHLFLSWNCFGSS